MADRAAAGRARSRPGAWHPRTHLELAHAGPAVTVVTVGLIFGVVAMRADLDPVRLLLLAGLLIGNQYAAGTLNDAVDVEEDAGAGRPKPIVTGRIRRHTVVALALAAGALSLCCALLLNWATFGLAALGLGCAFGYDLWLKRTPFSVLPFAIALPLVPLFGYAAAGRVPPVLWWALPIGALGAVTIHLADSLPDLDTDRAGGSRGLATRLGLRRAAALEALCYLAAVALVTLTATRDGRPLPAVAGAAVALGAGAAAVLLGRGGAAPRRRAYRLLLLGVTALAAGWAVAVRP